MADTVTRFTTEGLVIKEMKVGESDRLVTLFTREYGIIKAFAAGAVSIRSKKHSATAMLTYSSFTLVNKKGTNRIYEAAPIEQFFTLGGDIEVLSVSQYFCELALIFGENDVPNEELFRLILNSLHFLIKKKKYPPLIKAVTEFRTAVISGYMPNLIGCAECGKFEDGNMLFNLNDGSLLCGDCGGKKTGVRLNPTLLSALRHIAFSELKKLYSFEIPNTQADTLSSITESYIRLQTDQRFAALDFLNQIKGE